MAEGGLFQSNVDTDEHVKKGLHDPALMGKISKNINNVAASLRILEERYSNLRNKTQMGEQNLIDIEKDSAKDLKAVSEDILDLKHDIKDMKEKLELISNEVRNLVDKNEFRVLDRYIDMWQPMNFITRKELKRIIEDKSMQKTKTQTKKEETIS